MVLDVLLLFGGLVFTRFFVFMRCFAWSAGVGCFWGWLAGWLAVEVKEVYSWVRKIREGRAGL